MSRVMGGVVVAMSWAASVRRRAVALLLCSALGLVPLAAPTPAAAHDDGTGSAAEAEAHAREDLVGTSMSTIVRETRERARELGPVQVQGPGAAPRAAVASDPGAVGAWSDVVATPVVPVFQVVLPNGRVLMWDSVGDDGAQDGTHDHTRAMVWDPLRDTYRRVDVQGYNIFCAGATQLPDGDVLVVGGNKNGQQEGIRQTHLFDWQTETWSLGPPMDAERWYPSVAALADGSAIIVGGGPTKAEVYQNGVLRILAGFTGYDARIYPFLTPRTDGRVDIVGPGLMETIDTRGAGSHVVRLPHDDLYREYGSFATFAPDRSLVAGGGSFDESAGTNGARRPPLRSAKVVDSSTTPATVRPAAPMAFARRQFDLTVLPDATVLATGGMSTNPASTNGLVDTANPVKAAEVWDPTAGSTGSWTTLAPASQVRQYHSSAALLPDGRVLTGGGGVCGECVAAGYLERNLEYFSPPYLFEHDGSGALADRPRITRAPAAVAVGGTFSVSSPQAASIARLTLVKLGAPTHGVDQGQRFVPLAITRRSSGGLDAAAPATSGIAPPGYYMLFAIDRSGVPSVASMVQVTTSTPPPAPAPAPPVPPGPVRSGNLALDRPAGASGSVRARRPARAVDGRQRTWWQAPRTRTAWWRVDLGRSRSVDSVTVAPHGRLRGYRVQTSRDGRTYTTARTVPARATGRRTVRFPVRAARYVRVVATPASARRGFGLAEVGVFGPR